MQAALCAARHNIPGIDDAIFPNEIGNPFTFREMRQHFLQWYKDHGGKVVVRYAVCLNQADDTTILAYEGTEPVTVFVTGMTPALTSVISACIYNGIPLDLMHYNRETGDYVRQKIV